MAGETRKNVYLPQLDQIRDAILKAHSGGADAATLDAMFGAMINGENTTKIFRDWWELARAQDVAEAALEPGASDAGTAANRYHTLIRWFELLGKAWGGKYYTLRGADHRVNSTGAHGLTPMADLAKRASDGNGGFVTAACATETSGMDADWADEDPMTWWLRFNGLSLADGTMNVLAVEGVDPEFDITGNTAPVYTGRLGLWKLHFSDGSYEYKTFATQPEGAFKPWAGDVAPGGSHRAMNWEAAFGGSLTSGGKLTSGSGYQGSSWERNSNVTAINRSANAGLTAARLWDAYEGTYSDTDLEPVLDLFQLRHFDLENSGIIEGCLNYNLEYEVSLAEEGVRSVVLTAGQGANILMGSFLDIGTEKRGGQIGRGNVIRKEDVTIDGTAYCRVYLDLAADVNVTAGAFVCTLPWTPGSTEHLPGHKDGSLGSCTAGKTPARIAGVEIIDGGYAVGLDPLWNHVYDETASPTDIYTAYKCMDSENQAGSITANYEEVESFTNNGSARGWQYIKHLQIRTDGIQIPEAVGGSSTTFMKSAFSFAGSSGVRAPWRFANLGAGGYGGLAGADGYAAPGSAGWDGRPRLSGSGKKRGEWAA